MKHVVSSHLSLLLIVMAGGLIDTWVRHTRLETHYDTIGAIGLALAVVAFLVRLRMRGSLN